MRVLIALLILLATLPFPLAHTNHHTVKWTGPKAGHALYYTDSSFRRIGAIRVRQGYISHVTPIGVNGVQGYSAVTDCGKIGWYAYFRLNDRLTVKTQVLDCSHPAHAKAHVKARRVGEINEAAIRRAGCIWKGGETKGRCPALLVDIRRY